MENVTIINIDWEKIAFDYELIEEKCNHNDYGLYQLYGHHPAYGPDVLLYIGKARDQKFGVRLNQDRGFDQSCSRPTSFRLGRIVRLDEKKDSLG